MASYYDSRYGNLKVVDEPVYKSELTSGTTVMGGLYSQTADSETVTGEGVEGTLIGTGVGALEIPANVFEVGNSYLVQAYGIIDCENLDLITIKVLGGSLTLPVTLATTGELALRQASNKVFKMDIHFTIRAIDNPEEESLGAIITAFDFRYESDSSTRLETKLVISTNNNFSTAISNTLNITATFGQETGSIYTQLFNLYKIF